MANKLSNGWFEIGEQITPEQYEDTVTDTGRLILEYLHEYLVALIMHGDTNTFENLHKCVNDLFVRGNEMMKKRLESE
jgi:hypothetical protein